MSKEREITICHAVCHALRPKQVLGTFEKQTAGQENLRQFLNIIQPGISIVCGWLQMFLRWLQIVVEFFEVAVGGFRWLQVVPSFSNYATQLALADEVGDVCTANALVSTARQFHLWLARDTYEGYLTFLCVRTCSLCLSSK